MFFVDERGGLGFTVTGRETTKGERLFYIKTVMPNSPAHDDGRLRHGDRLLEVVVITLITLFNSSFCVPDQWRIVERTCAGRSCRPTSSLADWCYCFAVDITNGRRCRITATDDFIVDN